MLGKRLNKSTFFFIVAGVLALFIGIQVQSMLAGVKQSQFVQVVVVKDNVTIEPYKVIQAADVMLKEVPKSIILPDTLVSLQDVVGKRSATKMLPSTVIRSGHLIPSNSLVGVLSNLGKENLAAMTIPIETEQSNLGKVGEFVTLHGMIRQGTESALLSVRKVPILEKSDQAVTVAVTIEQADAVDQVLLSGGKIRFVLNQP